MRVFSLYIGTISLILLGGKSVFQNHSSSDKSPIYMDTLPISSYPESKAEIYPLSLENEAAVAYNTFILPSTKETWLGYKTHLKEAITKYAGVVVNHRLPLELHETGVIKKEKYTIRKIYFQTLPGVFATANLYVPNGSGVFPAVINTHGHWPGGKAGDMAQACAQQLALHGIVCLNIDAWGSGERTTIHGEHEYHGSNLGASLYDIGASLLGNQISDNIRGVDLLCSLSYVNPEQIGATGASGGGNQSMWLSAMDERIKACMPVVSVGTFQSYIMSSNCVCELLPSGLTFTEESGILSLIAPRALNICNALKDKNKAFAPAEMKRSYANASNIYALYHQKENIAYRLFDTTHGYWPEMRMEMIGFFDKQLKHQGAGNPQPEIPEKLLPIDSLMVFAKGERPKEVYSTQKYCIKRGLELEKQRASIVENQYKNWHQKLEEITNDDNQLKNIQELQQADGQYNYVLNTKHHNQITLHCLNKISAQKITVIVIPAAGTDVKEKEEILKQYPLKKYNVITTDLWGIGDNTSAIAQKMDGILPAFHTLSRAKWWFGGSVMNEWVTNLDVIFSFLKSKTPDNKFIIDADRELAVATLLFAAKKERFDTQYHLRNCPLTYQLKEDKNPIFFNMAIHIPGFLQWGDIHTLLWMSGKTAFNFTNPRSITGTILQEEELPLFKKEFLRNNPNLSIQFSKQ